MIVFRIIDNVEENFIKRLFYTIFEEPPKITSISFEGINIRYITYYKRGNKITWGKLSKLLFNKNGIVCNKELILPNEYNINKFRSSYFNKVVCLNTVLNIMEKLDISPQKLRICLYDLYADNVDILEKLAGFSSELKVITNEIGIYLKESNRLFEEFGASIIIKSYNEIQDLPSVIIAPNRIEEKLHINQASIVFTSECPKIDLDATLFYGYKLEIPKKYMAIIPSDIDPDYFISALCDIHGLRKLAALKTKYLVSYNKYVVVEDVLNQIKKLMTGRP